MPVTIGALKESAPQETRVSLTPEIAAKLAKEGAQVLVERGAGERASFPDSAYKNVTWAEGPEPVLAAADVLLAVQPLTVAQIGQLKPSAVVIGFMQPHARAAEVRALEQRGLTAFAMELVPRISRAQSMDALSSQAAIAGYKAVLIAASQLQKFFPMLTTAAGTIRPSQVLVIGAGVAGLQAIATARRLGAVVSAYDLRPVVKEQVQSLGARFVELPLEVADAQDAGGYAKAQDEAFYKRQRELLGKVIAESDVVITTAVVPGKKSPVLVTKEMVAAMAPGSVIVDLAAERGGNCELTRPEETVVEHGVTIVGMINLASTVPYHASQVYAKNLANFLAPLVKDGKLQLKMEDEIVRSTLITQDGEIVNQRVREFYNLPALAPAH